MKPAALLKRLASGQFGNVRFEDACRLALALGFELDRVRGSHHMFRHPKGGHRLNFQERGGDAKVYQLRQLLDQVERYDLELEDSK
jgi:predicted RNA binding protein YcfA (HicA-like mRNA interferase family)